jgi:hypothetical protein
MHLILKFLCLQDRLDFKVKQTAPQINDLKKLLEDLKTNALESDEEIDLAVYLATYISFSNGNANRPDVCDNFSGSEYLGWRQAASTFINSQKEEDIPLLRVSRLTINIFHNLISLL